jgi:iron complex outermembrane receptor protein
LVLLAIPTGSATQISHRIAGPTHFHKNVLAQYAISVMLNKNIGWLTHRGEKEVKTQVGLFFTATCSIVFAIGAATAYAQSTAAPGASTTSGDTAPAQVENPAQAADSSAGTELGEIMVTAQRRSESLERTPVAVSVLSSQALEEQGIVTEQDLQSATPGLTVRSSQNSNQLNYALRGQSLDAFSGTRPGVLPYFDEVQVGGGGGATEFYDLQSIQVLKGPQGTLFGRNATGGAVLFTTNKPQNDLDGYVIGRVGNYNLRYIQAAINVPIVADTLLFRVAGFSDKRLGYQEDVFEDEHAGDVDRSGVRASLTFKPTQSIKSDLVVDYFHAGGNSVEGPLYSLNPKGAVPLIALTNFGNAAQFDDLISGFVSGAGGPPNAGAGAAAAYAAANPRLNPGGLAAYLLTQQARGPYVVESNSPNIYRGDNTIIADITSFDVAEDTQIRNVLGNTRIDSDNLGDIDGTPYGIDDNGNIDNQTRQFSDELQLVGKAAAKRLTYVTGLFYSYESNVYINTGNILSFPIIESKQSYAAKTTNQTYAGYGQGTYDLSDLTGINDLAATAGARYTNEIVGLQTLRSDISFSDSPAKQATYEPSQTKSYDNTSWTVGLQDQLDPNFLVYVASRRSYRNGGFNTSERPVPGLGTEGGDGYGVETVTDVEFGTKYAGNFSTMPVRANIALYRDWVENDQRVAYTIVGGSPAAVTVNVPRAAVEGFELDSEITPISWLQVGASGAYTDAKFTNNLVSIDGGAPVVFGTYPDTPRWSGATFAEVTVPLPASLAASFRTDAYTQTSTWFSSTGNTNPGSELPSYTLVNFRLGLRDDKAGWSVAANLKNAFNRVYYVGGVALGQLFQLNTAVPGEPRTFYAEARYQF